MGENMISRTVGFFRRQQSPFKVNIARNIAQNFSLGLTQQYTSIYVTLLGASAVELGILASLGGVAYMLLSLPVGLLAERLGIKKVLLAAGILMIAGYAVFGLAVSWQVTAAAYVLTSLATQFAMTVCPMICGSCLKSSERVTGMQLCDTIVAFPRLLAPIAAAALITLWGGLTVEGIRPLYWIEVAGLSVSFLIVLRYFSNPVAAPKRSGSSFTSGLRRIFAEGVNIKRWIVYMMFNMFPFYMTIYIPLYAKTFKGATQFTLGMMDASYWLIVVLLAIPVGLSADRLGRKRLIFAMVPLYSLSLLVLAYVPGDVSLLLYGLLSGFWMLSGVTEASLSVELVPRDCLGSWYGMMGFFRGLIGFTAPIIGGFIWNTVGPIYILLFIAATQIAKLGILYTMPDKTKFSTD